MDGRFRMESAGGLERNMHIGSLFAGYSTEKKISAISKLQKYLSSDQDLTDPDLFTDEEKAILSDGKTGEITRTLML